MARWTEKAERELFRLFSVIRSAREAQMLLTDLLTPAEIRSLTKRWLELQELARGVSQREVVKKLHVSISKVTRGSRVLRHGTGGAWLFLKRLGKLKKPKKS